MKTWKIVLIVLAVIASLIGGLITLVFWATSGITDTADEFFAAAREGDYEKAYSLTSKDLQRDLNQDQLQSYLMSSGLSQVEETSWSSRSIENNTGNLSGEVITVQGATIPLEMRLIKEGEDWRIVYIERDEVGLAGAGGAGGAAIELPSAEDQRKLLDMANAAFVQSLGEPDFSTFHAVWVDGVTPQQMDGWFGDARPFKDDIQGVLETKPALRPARGQDERNGITKVATYVDSNGMFEVELGLIPTTGGGWGVYKYEYELK